MTDYSLESLDQSNYIKPVDDIEVYRGRKKVPETGRDNLIASVLRSKILDKSELAESETSVPPQVELSTQPEATVYEMPSTPVEPTYMGDPDVIAELHKAVIAIHDAA